MPDSGERHHGQPKDWRRWSASARTGSWIMPASSAARAISAWILPALRCCPRCRQWIKWPVGCHAGRHSLERTFDLTAHEILDIIHNRMRLEVAVKGGVAEHHLGRLLQTDSAVVSVTGLDQDAQPDFEVRMSDGSTVLVECKNVSPERYANGDFKVEVQKTRATSGDPAGRLYRPEQFDVVAACLYSPTRRWDFRFIRSSHLGRHQSHPDRLAATHRVDGRWSETLPAALQRVSGAS